ncbi:MAG: glycosyltransferase family 2 protein, partial [Oscillospiraceae bacterium]
MNIIYSILLVICIVSLVYILLSNTVSLVQLVGSSVSLSRFNRSRYYLEHKRYLDSENMIPITLMVAAHNEQKTILDTVNNLLSLDFPEYEVIIINDGSTDSTLQKLIDKYALVAVRQPIRISIPTKEVTAVYRCPDYPNLTILDKVQGGIGDALNAGINASRYPVYVAIDADSLLEKESLVKIIMPFVKDHRVVGVGGIVRVANGYEIVNGELVEVGTPKRPLINFQTIEYLRTFLTGSLGCDAMGILLNVSGAFGAFRKKTVIDVGGYATDGFGVGMDLVVKLHRHLLEQQAKYVIKFIPDPVCWVHPPKRIGQLYRQRKTWQTETVNSLTKNGKVMLNPKYKRIGLLAFPYYWLFEVIGPFLDLMGYIAVPVCFALGIMSLRFMLTFFA